MAYEPYVIPTVKGTQVITKTNKISKILKGVFDIFNSKDVINIDETGILLRVHLVDNNIVVNEVGDT